MAALRPRPEPTPASPIDHTGRTDGSAGTRDRGRRSGAREMSGKTSSGAGELEESRESEDEEPGGDEKTNGTIRAQPRWLMTPIVVMSQPTRCTYIGSGEGMLRFPFEPLAAGDARPALAVVARLVPNHLGRAAVVTQGDGDPDATGRHLRPQRIAAAPSQGPAAQPGCTAGQFLLDDFSWIGWPSRLSVRPPDEGARSALQRPPRCGASVVSCMLSGHSP